MQGKVRSVPNKYKRYIEMTKVGNQSVYSIPFSEAFAKKKIMINFQPAIVWDIL